MRVSEWIQLYKADEKKAVRLAFETYYPELAGLCLCLGKDRKEAEDMLCFSFYNCIRHLKAQSNTKPLDEVFRQQFIRECVMYIKAMGKDYFVGSTTDARLQDLQNKPSPQAIDFSRLDPEHYLEALHQLPPAQRLLFTLHVAEGYSLEECSELIETSLEACRYNLEKSQLQFNKLILQPKTTQRT